MDRIVSSNRNKCLLIIYSLYMRESSRNKSQFLILDAPISYVFDLIDPLGSHYRLPLRSQNNIPHIILHDGIILLHHGISPYWLTICLLITGRLIINDVAHSCGIEQIYLRSFSLSEGTMRRCMSFFLLQSLMIPWKSLPTYYNIFGNINWRYRINKRNCFNRMNCIPLN
jgi:hypothetical protein